MLAPEPITLRVETAVLPKTTSRIVHTGKGSFPVDESRFVATIDLNNPAPIVTDEFISEISNLLMAGKRVEVDCGIASNGKDFVAEEISSERFVDKIRKRDDLKVEANRETRRIRAGIFSLIGTKHYFVNYRRINEAANGNASVDDSHDRTTSVDDDLLQTRSIGRGVRIPLTLFERIQRQREREEDAEESLADYSQGSKYSSAPVFELEDRVLDHIEEIEDLVREEGIVQIKRKNFLDEVENLGMFVELDLDRDEVVINLNGQSDEHFEDLFTDLVIHYLESGRTVVVDWEADSSFRLELSVRESDVFEFIYNQTGVEGRVEERETPYANSHGFVVLEPNSP